VNSSWRFSSPFFLWLPLLGIGLPGQVAPSFEFVTKNEFTSAEIKSLALIKSAIAAPNPLIASVPKTGADPIASPYPIPWGWVEKAQAEVKRSGRAEVRTYQSEQMVSPDGEYAAYSQIRMQVKSQFTDSQISSALVIKHLPTGQIQQIELPTSLLRNSARPTDLTGTIAILWPVGWSQTGDRLLIRNFVALTGSDIASDSAVVWYRQSKRTTTILPQSVDYDTAVLMGWSATHPNQLLFRTSLLGNSQEQLWAVNEQGQTIAAPGDRPLIYGQRIPQN
jgi:hypothetical protein